MGWNRRAGAGLIGLAMLSALTAPVRAETAAEAEQSRLLAACRPAHIEAAFACLDNYWSPAARDEFIALAAKDVIETHFGIGQWMRNNWIRGGVLGAYFSARNIAHPDSMSSLLLEAYWLKRHGYVVAWNDMVAIKAAFERAKQGATCAQPKNGGA